MKTKHLKTFLFLLLALLLAALPARAQFIRFEQTDYSVVPNRLFLSNIVGDGVLVTLTGTSKISLRPNIGLQQLTNVVDSLNGLSDGEALVWDASHSAFTNRMVASTGSTNGFSTLQTVNNASNAVVALISTWPLTNAMVYASTTNNVALQVHQIANARTNILSLVDSSGAPKFVVGSNFWVGVLTNKPQAPLHIVSGAAVEPQLLIESPSTDIDAIAVRHGGVKIFDVTSTGGNGGVLNIFDAAGVPTHSFAHGADSYIDRNMEGYGLAIGTNNTAGYDLYIAGNIFVKDGMNLMGNTTNNSTIWQKMALRIVDPGWLEFVGKTNRVLTVNSDGVVTLGTVWDNDIASRSSLVSQATRITATNAIDFSTNYHQTFTVTNDTAFGFAAASTNAGWGMLTLYNGGPSTYNLYYPAFTRLDTGSLPPATISSNGFFTLVFRWQKQESHVAVLGDTSSVTVQTNGVDAGMASRLNFVGASVVYTAGTNTVTITGGAGGGLLMNADQFGTNATTAWIKSGAGITNPILYTPIVSGDLGLITGGNITNASDFFLTAQGYQSLTVAGAPARVGINSIASTATLEVQGASSNQFAFKVTGQPGSTSSVFVVAGTNGVPSIYTGSNGTSLTISRDAYVLGDLLISSNVFWRSFPTTNTVASTNFIVDFNRGEVELPSSAITNIINIVHTTNGPPTGSGTNCFTAYEIETGNTNRLLAIPSELQGNIYGTNTATATFSLPSNVVARIVFEKRTGLINGTYMSYPVWTP